MQMVLRLWLNLCLMCFICFVFMKLSFVCSWIDVFVFWLLIMVIIFWSLICLYVLISVWSRVVLSFLLLVLGLRQIEFLMVYLQVFIFVQGCVRVQLMMMFVGEIVIRNGSCRCLSRVNLFCQYGMLLCCLFSVIVELFMKWLQIFWMCGRFVVCVGWIVQENILGEVVGCRWCGRI